MHNSPDSYVKPAAPLPQPFRIAAVAHQEMPAMRVSGSARRFSAPLMTDELSQEFYTVAQLARRLQFTKMTIHRMVTRGELPCYMFGRVKRFHHRDIEAFLSRCRNEPTSSQPAAAAQTGGW
jgi:excisionase family DNA binding protein